ncbi:MAG: T9SS type A sorting domain-containing protein, partial [Bacteroidia bacterium]|nr:T9SS type A sorting domain-containing protein [Bacteroidia bacterium]
NWGSTPYSIVAGNSNGFTDSTVKTGEAFEYSVVKANGSNNDAIGYIYAGNKLVEKLKFDGLILLIDSNYRIPVASQINQLVNDLTAEGYRLSVIYAGRNQTPPTVKKLIQSTYNAMNKKVKTLFILGHVPVPYAGYFSTNGQAPPPDGHVEGSGNHTGAWPADVFYADMYDDWTDVSTNCTTGTQPRMYNIPGDGKFDQTKLPNILSLELGRVDLFNMPAFGKSDTTLIINYLNRDHNWRTGNLQTVERSLIDDNFTSLNLSSTGYNNFAALVKADSNFTNRDYISAQKNGSYLWSYGCGAGSFQSCNGIGNTNNFANDSFNNIFTILAGSFFGDWDNQNNFLRAPLAQSSLSCFWGGLPKWYVHHMGLGLNIGYGALITQNNVGFYFDGGFNLSGNSVHIALMGDPTLKMRNLNTVNSLSANSVNSKVNLYWRPISGNIDGYCIYKVDTINNVYSRLNTTIITDTFYIDNINYVTGNYTYAVKAIKLESTASGSYFNTGGAAFAKVNHVASGINENQKQNIDLTVFPNPSNNIFYINATDFISANSQILITDITGKEVYNYKILSKTKTIDIDLSGHAKGIYILNLQTNSFSVTKKLIFID